MSVLMRVFLLLFFFLSFVRGNEEPEVLYAPEAVYVGKPMTFRVQTHGHAGSILTNGVEWVRWPSGTEKVLESSLYPDQAMTVEVLKADMPVWRFEVLRPGGKGAFTERDGFLEMKNTPVILLPEAKLPPKLDRRWETLEVLRQTFIERKPALPEPLWLLPANSRLPERIADRLPVAEKKRVEPEPESWFRVNGFLMAIPQTSASFVAVELDLYDLKRGMPPHVWIMKWQFVLQHLQQVTGYEDGLLFAPELPADSEWHALLEEELQSLARAHNLRFIDRSREEVWQERLFDGLSRRYQLPEQ